VHNSIDIQFFFIVKIGLFIASVWVGRFTLIVNNHGGHEHVGCTDWKLELLEKGL
jgi:hypothetical protein